MINKIFSASGGISYQVRAAWNRKRWHPFCEFIDGCINEALAVLEKKFEGAEVARTKTLVLIGPNAGYTLPHRLIEYFSNIIVIEPDPLAFALFTIRFHRQTTWLSQDFFGLNLSQKILLNKNKLKGSALSKQPDAKKLNQLFASYPNAVFLFCNILGQLPVILREQKNVDVELYMKELGVVFKEASKNHLIASYHDRFSRDLRKPNEYTDHLTGDLFSGFSNKKEFPWQLTSRHEHQVEFVHNF